MKRHSSAQLQNSGGKRELLEAEKPALSARLRAGRFICGNVRCKVSGVRACEARSPDARLPSLPLRTGQLSSHVPLGLFCLNCSYFWSFVPIGGL